MGDRMRHMERFLGFRWCLWVFASEMFVTSPRFDSASFFRGGKFGRFCTRLWKARSIEIFRHDFWAVLKFDWICFSLTFLIGLTVQSVLSVIEVRRQMVQSWLRTFIIVKKNCSMMWFYDDVLSYDDVNRKTWVFLFILWTDMVQ